MEKQKRWHLYLILAVVLLTVYNILPTLFFYSNPLKKPIGSTESTQVAAGIIERVNNLENFTLSWLRAQSKNLGLKPVEIHSICLGPFQIYLHFGQNFNSEKISLDPDSFDCCLPTFNLVD